MRPFWFYGREGRMDDQQRRAKGLDVRRAVLGDAHVDRAMAQTTPLTEEFQDLITRYAWGEIWTRPGLDIRSRRILVIGTMIAIGRWDEFQMHAAAGAARRAASASTISRKSCYSRRSIAASRPRIMP
jgi:alkylhydroperoxidase/carboxymuconolactone decarboxylase family protein YurZ